MTESEGRLQKMCLTNDDPPESAPSSATRLTSGMDFAARLKVEAQAMARLSHPGIVNVFDVGETGDGVCNSAWHGQEMWLQMLRFQSRGESSLENNFRVP